MLVPPEVPYFLLFGFPVYYYGITLAVGILVGILFAHRVAVRDFLLFEVVPDVAVKLIIGGIVGARLYYCLLNYSRYFSNPLEIFAVREGGLSIHGALIGGAIVLFFEARKYKISCLRLFDIFALGLPIAQAIGRFGNFFNSEAFGIPTNLPWKMYIAPQHRPEQFLTYEYFHPAFLYESICNVLIFLVLYKFVLPRYKERIGVISASYLILYSLVRLLIEGLRTDCVKYVCGIPFPQLVSIVLIFLGVGFIFIQIKKEHQHK